MKLVISLLVLTMLTACTLIPPDKDEKLQAGGHISDPLPPAATESFDIPPVVKQVPIIAAPKPVEKLQTFTVVATNLPASELLFALARDARLNLDIDPGITGNVSINAIDQTLPQILKRIARQVSLRYYVDGPNLIIEQNKPFIRVYRIDYLNMARETESTVEIATQISTTGTTEGGGSGGNNSSTNIINKSTNDFWSTLEKNIQDFAGSEGEGSVITNREAGVISVKATASAHESIQEFLDLVLNNAQKQVLIEVTVVEVTLSDAFQSGVDWSRIASGDGWSLQQSLLGTTLGASPFVSATYTDTNSDRSFTAAIKALDSFGDVSVMSSPKIMALNNQTSVLKVVDNKVYFTTEVEDEDATDNSAAKTTITTTIHTVPVGFVMNVTPFITSNDEIILNIRPTISRILQFIDLPISPTANIVVENKIPEIQVREMESVLRVADGSTAVLGGLMQDSSSKNRSGLPGLGEAEGFGFLFNQNKESFNKTELVIFLRPRIIRQGSIDSDLLDFKRYLTPAAFTQ